MKTHFIISTFLILLFVSCGTTKQTSILHGDSYDETTGKTTYILVPYGNVEIKGKWKRTNYNQISRQQFFTNNDSATIAIAKNYKEKYPFYSENKQDFELVNDFYKWDSEYYSKQGYKVEILEENKIENYIIWQITSEKADNVFLFGLQNNLIINYMVSSNWKIKEKLDFLSDMYRGNQ